MVKICRTRKLVSKLATQGCGLPILTAMAQLTLPQMEHCTWLAPRGYMSTTRHALLLHTSCAMSLPVQGSASHVARFALARCAVI